MREGETQHEEDIRKEVVQKGDFFPSLCSFEEYQGGGEIRHGKGTGGREGTKVRGK